MISFNSKWYNKQQHGISFETFISLTDHGEQCSCRQFYASETTTFKYLGVLNKGDKYEWVSNLCNCKYLRSQKADTKEKFAWGNTKILLGATGKKSVVFLVLPFLLHRLTYTQHVISYAAFSNGNNQSMQLTIETKSIFNEVVQILISFFNRWTRHLTWIAAFCIYVNTTACRALINGTSIQ